MKRRNLAKGNLKEIPKQIRAQRYATPLNGSAVGRKGLRVYDGGWIRIENGGLQVTGTAIISGTLNVTGTTNLEGTNNLSGDNNLTGPTEISGALDITGATTIGGSLDVTGPTNLDGLLTINGDTTVTGQLNVTGPTKLDGVLDIGGNTTITGLLDVDGPTTISGTLGIEGVTTLKNDLNVTEGGKITAGNLEIEPANGGQINFLNGSLSSTSFGALLNNSIKVELLAPNVTLNATITDVSNRLNVLGQLYVDGAAQFKHAVFALTGLGTTSEAPNLYINPTTGRLSRSTWTP